MNQEVIRIDLNGVNCYLLKSGNNFILIDTGGHLIMDKTFTDRRELLEQSFSIAGCGVGNLKLIILTHGDNDHVHNAVYIRNKYKTMIAAHKNDCYLVKNPTLDDYMDSFHYSSLIYKAVFAVMRKKIRAMSQQILNDFTRFTPDIMIDDHFSLSNYGFEGEILHLPGHTPGSVGILVRDNAFISGDLFANLRKPGIAPNAYDFKALIKNAAKLRAFGIDMVYPGHGKPFDFMDL